MDDSTLNIIAGIFLLVLLSIIIFAIWHNREIVSDEERIRFANEHRRELERNRSQVEEIKRKALENPSDVNPVDQCTDPITDAKSTRFNFWWPTSKTNGMIMLWVLVIIGVLLLLKGYYDENTRRANWRGRYGLSPRDTFELFFSILFFYSVVGVVAWCFIINIGRYAYHTIVRTI